MTLRAAAALFVCVLAGAAEAQSNRAPDADQRVTDLARAFQDGTPCTLSGAESSLSNLADGAVPKEALVALGMYLRTPDLCSPARNAAESLRAVYASRIAASEAPALAAVVALEAQRPAITAAADPAADAAAGDDAAAADKALVARLQFEVGPPPPNLTRGRVSTP